MTSQLALKTLGYILLSAPLGVAMGAEGGEEDAAPSAPVVRTEIKASLEPTDRPTPAVAESVGKAIAAEIISAGFKTEVLRHRLEATPRPPKVAALNAASEPAPGQADQL